MSVMGIGAGPRRIGVLFERQQTSSVRVWPQTGIIGDFMRRGVLLQLQNAVLRHVALPALALIIGVGIAAAQSGDSRAPDQSGKPAGKFGSADRRQQG